MLDDLRNEFGLSILFISHDMQVVRALSDEVLVMYFGHVVERGHADAIEDFFKRGAKNCTKCKEIRPNGVIPCNRCVELAGEALDFLDK